MECCPVRTSKENKNENLILNLLKVPYNDLTAGKPLLHMISRISYFVIYSPNYIETARHNNFYLGSMSALLQQLRHYYTCYFNTGDTKNIFGAVTPWPHIHAGIGQRFAQLKLTLCALHLPTGDLKELLSCWSRLLSLFLSCLRGPMTRVSDGKN